MSIKTLPESIEHALNSGATHVACKNDLPLFAGTADGCWVHIHTTQGQSVDWACKNNGYAIMTVEEFSALDPDTLVTVGAYGEFGSVRAIRSLATESNTYKSFEHVKGILKSREISKKLTQRELFRLVCNL
jgi:hypothetical protein